MTSEPKTIWGIPVIESDWIPSDQIKIVVGSGVIRQDLSIEWEGDVITLRGIGDPYDPAIKGQED